MSRSIKVQTSKLSQNSKLETLLNSYTSLKSILSPNLSENNNIFMNSLMDLIISQLKVFLKLLSLKDEKKVFNIINSNNQDLSKQIAFLYELPKSHMNTKISFNSSSEKKIDSELKNYKKESYSPENKNESFRVNPSENLELLDLNNNKTESKENGIVNDDNNENINNNNDSESHENNIIKIKQRNLREFKDINDKFIKVKTPEKNVLMKSLNFSNNKYSVNTEKKEKGIKVKRQKVMKKLITNKTTTNEKENKIQPKRNDISMRNYSKTKLNNSKSTMYEFSTYKSKNSKNTLKINDKPKSLYKKIIQKKSNNENAKNDNNQSDININRKSEKKLLKSKTYIKQSMPLSNLLDISSLDKEINEKEKNNKYLSSTHSERILPKIKAINNNGNNNNNNNNLSSKQNNSKDIKKKRTKSSSSNSSLKIVKNVKKNKNSNKSDFFSLDEFLIPQTGKDGEKFFYTKKGKVLINKKQKDILEDYVNNYLFDEDDSKGSSSERKGKLTSNKSVKELINMNSNKSKNYIIKGTSTHYNSKDILEVLQLLPNSLNNPIDDYYLRKKRASLFDMGIFKICHNVIDNYKKLEGKGELYNYKKTNSNNQNNQK